VLLHGVNDVPDAPHPPDLGLESAASRVRDRGISGTPSSE
jgi:hypothetical protein